MRYLLLAGVLLTALLSLALTENAPNVTVHGSVLFRDVIVEGDLLAIARYEMDELQWQDFGPGGTLAQLRYNGVVRQQRVPPSLGHALVGFYLEPGHGIPWATDGIDVRLISNPALFENNTSSTFPIPPSGFRPTEGLIISTPQAQADMCEVIKFGLDAIQVAEGLSGDLALVSEQGQITDAGTLVAMAAFNSLPNVLPNCFAAGVTGTGEQFSPGDPALRNAQVSLVEASQLWQRWVAFCQSHDLPPVITATFITIGLALFFTSLISWWVGPVFGTCAGVCISFAGSLAVPHFLLQIVFVVIMIAVVLSLAFWWQKVPR